MLPALFLVLLLTQSATTCTDLSSCRQAALDAYAAKDFERFHDLAWEAYRRGRADDPELMLLLARAQSLSGRPGDAIVMLERLMARGITTDAATSEDFAPVRALPRWKAPDSAAAKAPDSAVAKAPVSEAPKAPDSAAPKAPNSEAPKAPDSEAPSTLTFSTLLSPSALAYDAVSRRYLIADRQARRVAIIDEHTGQVSTLAGAQAAFGDVTGIAIDPRLGDLWVVSSAGGVTSLHRLQLISGRVLSTVPLPAIKADVVALAFTRTAGLVLADTAGDIWRVRATGRAEKVAALEYVPRAMAADASGFLYIAAGGSRLGRYSVSPNFRRVAVIDLEAGIPPDAPFAVASDRIHFVVPSGGAYEIRTVGK